MSDTAVQLRAATLDDIDEIVKIERASFSDPWSARSFRELVGRRNVICAVAIGDVPAGGEAPPAVAPAAEAGEGSVARNGATATQGIVGFSVVYLAGLEGDLANLATSPTARRTGVGRRLLEHVLQVARSRGAHTIFLEVRESNSAARALYSSAGFVDVGRRKKYYARPVEDALVLRKELS